MTLLKKQRGTDHEKQQEVPGVPERKNENSKEGPERVRESVENA